ncbi:MAG: diacylglycerol kinase family lipid kinase, partial [Pseudonocardiales bacterium]|nr:diacylglycerol kinase family lipid kinase [Pseudonocardiales bacterium]
GKPATQPLYVRSAIREYFFGPAKQAPLLTLERPGAEPLRFSLALICQADPWTYLGERPVRPCPDASFDSGLDVFGLRELPMSSVLRHLRQILTTGARPKGKHVVSLHDLDGFTLTADGPLPFQLDGDDLGDRTSVVFKAVPDALQVIV